MNRLDVDDLQQRIKSITDLLKGLSYHQSLEVLCETISALVTAHNRPHTASQADTTTPISDEPIVDVTSAFRYLQQSRRVPKKIRPDPYAPVWEYLETIETYISISDLRKQLVERFGESATPSTFKLHSHIQAYRARTGNQDVEPLPPFNSSIFCGHRLSSIEKDPEIYDFILNIDHYCTLNEVVEMIRKRFGTERAITKSSLQRFTSKIAKEINRGNQ